jgi:hypothetical protein
MKKIYYLTLFAALSFFTACSYEEEIAEIRQELDAIKVTQKELLEAYNSGKLITNVTSTEDGNGWLISFSDNTSITINSGKNGNDGITPYLKIDENNYWIVSYDNGETFNVLLDKDSNPVVAVGKDGEKGADGNSIRIKTNDQSQYVIEIYNPTTGEVVDTIETKYVDNSRNVIKSIVEDDKTNTITITMESGEEFVFKQMIVNASGIVLLDKELNLRHGDVDTIVFRVNPSNVELNFENIYLDLVENKRAVSEVSYINKPTDYFIKSIEKCTDADGNKKRGQYMIIVQDNETNPYYRQNITIVLSMQDSDGNPMEISSDVIMVNSVGVSDLPIVMITTPNNVEITSKTDWYKNSNIRIIDEDGNECMNASTSVRGRGNSTWSYPKKPYAIKLDSKAEVLGMPKHKRWVLLANWMDRTLLRNDVSFEIARRIMDWAPRGKFVELYLNGKHQGNYYLCEHIKVDKNRVNVDELDEDTNFSDESEVSGGYILEYDTYGPNDEINYFYTSLKNFPVTIKEPDEEVITSWTHPGFSYINGYINNVEKALVEHQSWETISNLIDINSYIDWWLIHEVAYNREPQHPKSSYMYKKRNGKLYAGPVWDFDWGTYRLGCTDIALKTSLYYYELLRYDEFKLAVKARWAETKSVYESIDDYIVKQAKLIEKSNEINIGKWPITITENQDIDLPFSEAIERMRQAYSERLNVINSYISSL